MATIIHFIDVGQGNMVLVQCADGTHFMVDCNITEDNKNRVLNYVANQIGQRGRLGVFICTHRDADHMRGVRTLHGRFPIGTIWDSGYQGTTIDSPEYKEYMQLRRDLPSHDVSKNSYKDWGRTHITFLSGKDARLPSNANDQGLVLKVEERDARTSMVLGSTILTGDGSSAVWRDGILKDYLTKDLSCNILMAAHHGSFDFFDSLQKGYHYPDHIRAIAPDMTIISVGPNNYGHPDPSAVKLYEQYSSGSSQGHKVFRTDKQGTMKLTLKTEGSWNLNAHQ